jgi:cation:H+ antiporter
VATAVTTSNSRQPARAPARPSPPWCSALPRWVTLVAEVFLERSGDAIADHVGLSGVLFGGNAFLPVLFLIGTLVSGQAILPHAEHTDIYLTALAAHLTLVYAAGLLFRPRRRVAGIGVDSLVVLVLYAAGIGGLIAIATS